MDIRYEISQILGAAFGFNPDFYFTVPIPIGGPRPPIKYPGVEITPEKFYESRPSWLGTPIVMPLRFLGGNNIKRFNERGEVVEERYGDFDLPAATLVDFTRTKEFSKTMVAGGAGTVKEVYAFSDWEIRIRGLCLDEPGVRTAEEQKRALLLWEQVVESIKVAGQAFDDTLVFNILITKITFRELEGQPSTIPFEIEAISDEPIELIL